MTKLEEYKRKKEIERLGLPLIYIVKSTRKGIECFNAQTVDICEGGLRCTKDGNILKPENYQKINRYIFDNEPWEVDIVDGETYSIVDGYGSGIGDLWEWRYLYSIDKELADNYAVTELERITKTYLKPHKSIFLIEKGWIDPMENRNADGYEPFGYRLTEEDAKEFCNSKGFWTGDDCYSINYYPNKIMHKYKYTEIPFCYGDDK